MLEAPSRYNTEQGILIVTVGESIREVEIHPIWPIFALSGEKFFAQICGENSDSRRVPGYVCSTFVNLD